MHLKFRTTCRGCGNPHLANRFSLGNHFLHGNFYNPNKEIKPPLRKTPIELVQCDTTKDEAACGLYQLSTTIPPEVLYYDYGYRSGRSQTMVSHLKSIVDKILEIKPMLKYSEENVLDIACNDGTMLKFYPSGLNRIGVDGGSIPAESKDDTINIINDFFPSGHLIDKTFSCISAIACLYDIEDLSNQ